MLSGRLSSLSACESFVLVAISSLAFLISTLSTWAQERSEQLTRLRLHFININLAMDLIGSRRLLQTKHSACLQRRASRISRDVELACRLLEMLMARRRRGHLC